MSLEGVLNYLDIAHLLKVVEASAKSGELHIRWQEREARLFFQRGRLILAESDAVREGIGTLLVEAGLLSAEDLETALAAQRCDGEERRLGALLCDEFGVDPEELQRLLRLQFERIVYEIFSWPGGEFSFHFREPDAVLDRFHLAPVEFILGVGIQAGLLAEAGVERERGDPRRRALVVFEHDRDLVGHCRSHWRRQGHRVACFGSPREVMGCLTGWGDEEPEPVVLVDLAGPEDEGGTRVAGLELLDAVRELRPACPTVVLGDDGDAEARRRARDRGVRSFVAKPKREELDGPGGEGHLDVFLMQLDRAVATGIVEGGRDETGP